MAQLLKAPLGAHPRATGQISKPQGRQLAARRPAQLHTPVATAHPSTTTSAPAGVWDSFASAVAGEWQGVTASFSAEGKPKPLPDYYVPEAYREWGVTLYDWQSQSSVQAEDSGIRSVHRRMMPTVGCEADAIAFSEQEAQLFSADGPNAIAADGSFSLGPLDLSAPGVFSAVFQHCLPLGDKQRVRVLHKLQRMGAESRWKVADVEMHKEQWEGPWTGERELVGCAGQMDTFAMTEPLDASSIEGRWAAAGVKYSLDSSGNCSSSEVQGEAWAPAGLPAAPVGLPLGVWTCAAVDGDNVSISVGVLQEGGRMQLASRHLVSGEGTQVELLSLEKAD